MFVIWFTFVPFCVRYTYIETLQGFFKEKFLDNNIEHRKPHDDHVTQLHAIVNHRIDQRNVSF